MAESGKKAQPQPTAESAPQGQEQAVDEESRLAVRNEAPETPRESRNASLRVKTAWPHTSFKMEDVPEIKAEGTMLTKTQYEQAEKVAAENGVRLIAEEVK